jgi:hypothetical protein
MRYPPAEVWGLLGFEFYFDGTSTSRKANRLNRLPKK